MKRTQIILKLLAVLLVALLAWTLRSHAVNTLPIDYDEDDYLRAGQEYAHLIRTSDWAGFLETNYRTEHPPLAKIAYGIVFSFLPEQPLVEDVAITAEPAKTLPDNLLEAGRREAASFGTLMAALLAFVNPLAGFLLAIHTFNIKYTSQIMLDGLSALLSLSAVMTYAQYKKQDRIPWLIVSAFLLGLAADTKYLHGTVGFAILVDYLLAKRESITERRYKPLLPILGWGILSLAIFFVFNPYLWPDPFGRLQESFSSVSYTITNPNVGRANFPIWQPFSWLFFSPYWWHESVFPFPFDPFITVFAVFGLKRLWEKERLYALWLGIAMTILLIWPTKWPQYILILGAPLSLAAAEGALLAKDGIIEWWKNRRTRVKAIYSKLEIRRALPWLIPGLTTFLALTIFPLLFQIAVSTLSMSGNSMRDAFQGGIWRELLNGITGQANIADFAEDGKVHFIGLLWYSDVLNWIGALGLPFFNTMWTVVSVTLQTVLGVFAALLLWQRGIKFGKGWQALFILPWAIPEAIGTMLWLNIFAPVSGWLNLAAQKFGNGFPLNVFAEWQNNQNLSMLVLLTAALWYGFPFIMLAASAGLKLLPPDVFDAAAIDGASAWQTFRYVTWPLLMPLVAPAIIIRAIFAFNQFYLFQMFYYINEDFNMFTFARLSYFLVYNAREISVSAIVNIVTILFLTAFIILFNRWSKAGEGVTYA